MRRHSLHPTRRMINSQFVNTDRLISDLEFWMEVERFKDQADYAIECARSGNYTLEDENLLLDKAKTIVKCYIDSDVPPRVQVCLAVEWFLEEAYWVGNKKTFYENCLALRYGLHHSCGIYVHRKFDQDGKIFLPVIKKRADQQENNIYSSSTTKRIDHSSGLYVKWHLKKWRMISILVLASIWLSP